MCVCLAPCLSDKTLGEVWLGVWIGHYHGTGGSRCYSLTASITTQTHAGTFSCSRFRSDTQWEGNVFHREDEMFVGFNRCFIVCICLSLSRSFFLLLSFSRSTAAGKGEGLWGRSFLAPS